MTYAMESPWMKLGGKISKKRTKIIWAERANGKRFTQLRSKRSTPPSVEELARRNKFRTVRQAAIQRSMDLSKLTYDQMDFVEERRTKGAAFKYTSYKGWLFGKAWKCYDESTNQVNMPERLNTIG